MPSSFEPECSIPTHGTRIVFGCPVRSTFTILWSSLFTLLLCTWTILHLNVPQQRPSSPKLWQMVRWKVRLAWTKLKWMIFAVLLPEFPVGKAIQDLAMARKSCKEMARFAQDDDVEWTLTHAFYANMGGFVYILRTFSPLTSTDRILARTETPARNSTDTGRVKTFEGDRESMVITEDRERQNQNRGPSQTEERSVGGTEPTDLEAWRHEIRIPFNAQQLLHMRQEGMIPRLPSISEAHIQDKSKSDFFVKATAVVQVLWLVVQVISRAAKHLPISQLEIAVIAFSACALITYALNWSKPQDVQTPTYVEVATALSPHDFVSAIPSDLRAASWFTQSFTFEGQTGTEILTHAQRPVPNDLEVSGNFFPLNGLTYVDDGVILAGLLFGALHCLAWDFVFPSPVEQLIWRISAVLTTVVPAGYALAYHAADLARKAASPVFLEPPLGFIWTAIELVLVVPVVLYIVARIYLMIEVFRTLFFLPPKAFEETWSWSWLHVG